MNYGKRIQKALIFLTNLLNFCKENCIFLSSFFLEVKTEQQKQNNKQKKQNTRNFFRI